MSGWLELPTLIAEDELAGWAAAIPRPLAVTGATGFIGIHLVEALLRAKIRPRVLVRDPVRLTSAAAQAEIVRGDLDDHEALLRLTDGAATVVHLAGLVRAPSEARFDHVNRGGTEALLAALRERAPSARLVHVSSLAAAGPSVDPAGKSPNEPAEPVSAYGRSKLAGERAAATHPGPWLILRPPAVYGPRDIDILQFFRLVSRGWVPIPAGERYVTVAFVVDVVRAILAAAASGLRAQVLHLGDREPLRLDELIGLLGETGGCRARVVRLPPTMVRAVGWCGDRLQNLGFRAVAMTSDKARELLACHWSARTEASLRALGLVGTVPFRDGARVTWAWYREQGWVSRDTISRV